MILTEAAPAKLNLALHVRRRRADGYHDLETLFAFVEAGDVLHAEPADTLSLSVDGPFAADVPTGDDNLVLRAARSLGAGGAALRLTKNLPVASGIGGGSADAAATLRILNRLWGLARSLEALAEIGMALGADIPACVHSRSLRGDGKGDALRPVATGYEGRPVLLVNPRIAVPTGAVFKAWDGIDRGSLDAEGEGRNDLEGPARAIAPIIGDVLEELTKQPGAGLVRMSGSGATCFAVFETADDCAQAAASLANSGWWAEETSFLPV